MIAAVTSFSFIDTLHFSKRMQKAGMQQDIAEELAEAIRESQFKSAETFATKDDMRLLRNDLKNDIDILEKDIDAKLETLKRDLLIKLGTIMVVGTSILGCLIKF